MQNSLKFVRQKLLKLCVIERDYQSIQMVTWISELTDTRGPKSNGNFVITSTLINIFTPNLITFKIIPIDFNILV